MIDLKLPISEYLHQAQATELGISIRTNHIKLAREKLYAEMRKNPEFKDFQLTVSLIVPNELWILKDAKR